jgi:ABC-2 type transport system permease protein
MMYKILLIIKREYLTRIRKRSFIVMSFVGPVLFGLMFLIPIWLVTREGEQKLIEVLDESGYFQGQFNEKGNLKFKYIDQSLEKAKEGLSNSNKYGILYIPPLNLDHPEGIIFFAEQNPSIEVQSELEQMLKRRIEDIKLEQSGIDKEKLEKIKTKVSINTINVSSAGEKEGDTGIATAAGYLASLLIYFFIFMYGIQVMRGVIEEKSNRIVEVIVSSVRPFQLMMGKIIGVGAVGLTQFVLWTVLSMGIYTAVYQYYMGDTQMPDTVVMENQMAQAAQPEAAEIFAKIDTINFPLIIGSFVFYFLAAYLFYGSLFAAVGSAVDNDSDAQQFQLPVTLPLIFSVIILTAVIREPHGTLAFWTSIIPFTSPVIMMMRIPFDPPAWQIVLSMVLLVLGFITTTWMAGRIYRIGILFHGGKISYKVLAKWMFMKY